MNKKKESDLKEVDLSRIKYIIFVHTPSNDSGIENIVEIQEAGFYIDWLPVFFKIIIGIVTYFTCAFLIYYYILRKPVNPSVNFTYQKIESVNHKDREEVIINNFLIENFYNPELSISDIRAATGLSERRISAIIKSKADVSFKQYLNQIRMAEAKKLLVETDLQISEIAFRTGYGSASHFNRVFKSTENCSPNDFRKMHAQKPASST
ncbi:MAG TPA: AraC family transcriptional regulator [Cytophagaceae bacterium]